MWKFLVTVQFKDTLWKDGDIYHMNMGDVQSPEVQSGTTFVQELIRVPL